MTTEAPDEEAPTPRKGRGNAILTYETIAEIDHKLTHALVKLDFVSERLAGREVEHRDHEVRIRALELAHAGIHASSASNNDIWKWVWAAVVSVAMVALSALNYLK